MKTQHFNVENSDVSRLNITIYTVDEAIEMGEVGVPDTTPSSSPGRVIPGMLQVLCLLVWAVLCSSSYMCSVES